MQVAINQVDYEVPFDPMLITLQEFIDYQKEYGSALDSELKEIIERHKKEEDNDGVFSDLSFDIDKHVDKEALSWFSFWTKLDLLSLMGSDLAMPLINSWRTLRVMLVQAEEQAPIDVFWRQEWWSIQNYVLSPDSDMTFNEIITSKEAMRQTYKLGLGKWDGMPYLCAIFFRKTGELFTDDMIYDKGERVRLMRELPLSYALMVGFFLKICVSTARNILVSSLLEKDLRMTQNQNY